MSDDTMSLKEFRDFGFLQEANRQFFHPLGLALGVYWDEEDPENEQGADTENDEPAGLTIFDWRDDPEGNIFHSLQSDADRERADRVFELHAEKAEVRQKKFGWVIQPIGHRYKPTGGGDASSD